MAERRRQTSYFLKLHALRQGSGTAKCVFCGGTEPATERDHVPARALFVERKWPEGYEFPACSACNRGASGDEQVLGLLVRLRNASLEVPEKEFRQAVTAVVNNHPGLAESMIMSLRDKRRALAQLGVPRAVGAGVSSVPLLTVRDPRWQAATQRYGRKLARALFYLHTERIAPADSAVIVRWLTALSPGSESVAAEFAQLTAALAIPMRAGTSLDEQFVYRYAVSQEPMVGAFFVLFSPSLCLLILLDGREPEERSHQSNVADD